MTRDEDWDRVCTAGVGDGAHGFGLADLFRDPRVRPGLAARNFQERAPDFLLEGRAGGRVEPEPEAYGLAGQVRVELRREFCRRDTGSFAVDPQRSNFYRTTAQMNHNATNDKPSHIKKRFRFCRCSVRSGRLKPFKLPALM